MDVQGKGTISQASPLRVIVDGATVDSPAKTLDAATYLLNARVTLTIRNPEIPMINGVES